MKTIDMLIELNKRVTDLTEIIEQMENMLKQHDIKINDNSIDIKMLENTLRRYNK